VDSLIQINHSAPDFELPDLTGVPYRLAGAQGQVLLLHFWSAECPWAQRGDEILAELKLAWGDRIEL